MDQHALNNPFKNANCKGKPQTGRKYETVHIPDKELVLGILKKILKLINKKTNNPIKGKNKRLEQLLYRRRYTNGPKVC